MPSLNQIPLYIDSDNALGSPFGDIDDAYAIACVMRSGKRIEALASVFGNTFEPLVYRNHKTLSDLCGYTGQVLRGAGTWWSKETEASRYLAGIDHKIRILSIGPMTNIALALRESRSFSGRVSEVVFLGTNLSWPLPALRFFDFNQWKDSRATREVFESDLPLTCIPCDVARELRITEKHLSGITSPLGEYLRLYSARWFRRAKLLKWSDTVPVWDLVAAIYILKPELFEIRDTTVVLGKMGQGIYGISNGRPVRIVTKFDPTAVWSYFLSVL